VSAPRHVAAALLGAAALGRAPVANALEPGSIAGKPVRVDITDVSSVLYNFDNRDTQVNQVTTRANDRWGMWYNRYNVQANWGDFRVGLRLDNAWFFRSPNATQLALDLVTERERPLAPGATSDPIFFRRKLDEAGVELSNRYQNWLYPAKYSLGWSTREAEVDLGDFYAQFGRGFVLSVRKIDELSSDTTVRGVRVGGKLRVGSLRMKLTGLGGSMNPLRLDEASGRWLGSSADSRPGFVAFTEAGMPRAIETDFVRDGGSCATFGNCSYAPDRLAAAQFEIGTDDVKFGTQGSMIARQPALNQDVVRSSDRVLTASQSIELPNLGGHGAAYVEFAVQDLRRDGQATVRSADGDSMGHALYGSLSLTQKPATLSIEGRSYRRFFPLAANVNLNSAREFSLVQYSAPPTTEAIWVDSQFNGFNTCVTGGRARADVEVGSDENVFLWVSRSHTWAESSANEGCTVARANENRVWDLATGFELTSQRRRSRAVFTWGVRLDRTVERPLETPTGTTDVYYQEGYLRYDVIRALGGPFALQLQGWHRRRRETELTPEPWFEGQHLTGFEWAPKLSTAFGVEYDTKPGVPDWYFNGQVVWRFTSDTSIGLFIGQRRGALRCVAGVCRVFPPFEGARLDATVRF
jgi:hypothetical protein